MCTGRVDLEFVLRAFANGMDGVFVGGCRLNECNYITQGNYHALNMALLSRRLLEHSGLNPERLSIEFMSAGEGIRFADVTNAFVKQVTELGPLGEGEGLDVADVPAPRSTIGQRITGVGGMRPDRSVSVSALIDEEL